jgi:membrane protease YdiL (CAAX protease family)
MESNLLPLAQPTRRRRRAPAQAPRDARAVWLWLLAGAVVLSLFYASNVSGLGRREYFYRASDAWFFVRRLSLLGSGLLGLCLWQSCGPLQALQRFNWRLRRFDAAALLLYGAVLGALSPLQRVTGGVGEVLGLVVLHVVCEEIFFRGFLTRMLLDQLSDTRLAAVLSAMLYGLYHATYYSFWVEQGWQPRLFYMGLIALFAGLPYALMVRSGRTLLYPGLCHLALCTTMMAASLHHRGH